CTVIKNHAHYARRSADLALRAGEHEIAESRIRARQEIEPIGVVFPDDAGAGRGEVATKLHCGEKLVRSGVAELPVDAGPLRASREHEARVHGSAQPPDAVLKGHVGLDMIDHRAGSDAVQADRAE